MKYLAMFMCFAALSVDDVVASFAGNLAGDFFQFVIIIAIMGIAYFEGLNDAENS